MWIREAGSLSKTVLIIIIISLLGKVFGFAREFLLAYYYGTSSIVDIFLMSMTIPSVLFGFLPALGVGFTPIYFEIEDEDQRVQFVCNILLVSVIISIVFVMITFLLNKEIVSFCAPGFSDESKRLTVAFLNITVCCVIFNTPVRILSAYLNCNQDYLDSNISNLFVSITQAMFVVLAAKEDIIFLPLGIVVPWIIQFAWLLYASFRKGFRLIILGCYDAYVKKLLVISIPLFFSNILVDINGFVDKMLSSSLHEGMLSALNYSFLLRAVFITTASVVITTIVYPRIAQSVKNNEMIYTVTIIEKYSDYISFIIIPIMFLGIVFAEEIVSLVFMRGHFDLNSVKMTAAPFSMYMISLVVIVWKELLIKIMYSFGQTKRALLYSLLEIAMNVCFSLVLINNFEHVGLALATTISAFLSFPLYVNYICGYLQKFNFKNRIVKILKECFSAIIMIIISLLSVNVLKNNGGDGDFLNILKIVISIGVGLAMYILCCYVLRVSECKKMISSLIVRYEAR